MSRFEEAVKIAQGWPADKSVPMRLLVAYNAAKGMDRQLIGSLSEALMVAAESEEDLALVAKYFG
jgi:hypothetical protein